MDHDIRQTATQMKKASLRLPVVSLGAEHLVMGHLLRMNILTYKAPPNYEGYNLICINPDPKKTSRVVRKKVAKFAREKHVQMN